MITEMSQIPKGKDILLMFSMKYCPYCTRQESTILYKVKPEFKDIEYFKVMNNTKLFNELIATGNFDEVRYFPTTFILKVDQNDQMNVKYEFLGYQDGSYLLEILNDKEIMED